MRTKAGSIEPSLGVGILARGGATGLGEQKGTTEVMPQRGSLCCDQGLRGTMIWIF